MWNMNSEESEIAQWMCKAVQNGLMDIEKWNIRRMFKLWVHVSIWYFYYIGAVLL